MSDPSDPIAIVQAAAEVVTHLYADIVTQHMAQAQSFGRKTLAAKVATGKELISAMDEIDRRNGEIAKRKDQISKEKTLARFGFSKWTAQRLMTAARSHNSRCNLHREFDAVYDDGTDQAETEGKHPCRDCRIRGKKFDAKCAGCRALNRPTPQPKEDKAVLDMDGEPVPEHLIEAFRDGHTIREFNSHLLSGTKSLVGLMERPGCKKLNIPEIEKRLRSLFSFAVKYRPGKVCADCAGNKVKDGKTCQRCEGEGWVTVMKVADERAAEANEKKRRNGKEWRQRQSRMNEPIPE